MFLSLIKEKLKDLLSLFKRQKKPEYSFVFPYSEDKVIKRQQIWDNLQNGLLIEDSKTTQTSPDPSLFSCAKPCKEGSHAARPQPKHRTKYKVERLENNLKKRTVLCYEFCEN